MVPEEIITSLSVQTDSKIVLLILDGLGDVPTDGRTPLEVARTPHLDALAVESVCGLTDPVSPGITPGSGPSHLAIFGYDPLRYQIGRGVLEALGVDLEMTEQDLAARGNFATTDGRVIVDRRAGRIPTEENQRLCQLLREKIDRIDDVELIIKSGREHRFVILFRGSGLRGELADADPQKEGKPARPAEPLVPEAAATAHIVNTFIQRATEELSEQRPANTVLLRGFTTYPLLPSMSKLFKLRPAAVATYPMYRGLARLVGMEVLETKETVDEEFKTVRQHFGDYDFFYIHVKKTDSSGEDGNFQGKVEVIEEVDTFLPLLLDLKPDVLVVTSDHSTPARLKSHSWHPNPFLLRSSYILVDEVNRLTERGCARGGLGRFPSVEAMSLMLANALKLSKFGA